MTEVVLQGPAHLSKSQLSKLLPSNYGCALAWKREFLDKEEGRPLPAKVTAGSALDKAIERYALAKKSGAVLPTESELVMVALSSFDAGCEKYRSTFEDAPNDRAGLQKDLSLAVECFMREIAPTMSPWGVQVKAPVTLRFDDGTEQLIEGWIDYIEAGVEHPVIDWKFTQRFTPTKEPTAEQVLYSLWASGHFNEAVTRFDRVCFVRSCTKKDGQRVRIEHDVVNVTPDDRAWYIEYVIKPTMLARKHGVYTANTNACGGCRFAGVGVCRNRGQEI